jgi:hypothetical protein
VTARLEANGRVFSTGRSRFLDSDSRQEPTPKIFVKILAGNPQVLFLAQLDTGAAWSVLNAEIARMMGLFERPGPIVSLSSRSGVFHGTLVRTELTLVADEGESLDVETTLFASRDWTFGNFLGYAGLLERVRFALDPAENDFFFGSLSGDSSNHHL